ncbi:glycosyl hydrolase catalytic core-domain-containing protein [Mycena leptocephala]|nr:glycosyl hydrolase catalytic core-domain-containing protein [Mycena leptocephala]
MESPPKCSVGQSHPRTRPHRSASSRPKTRWNFHLVLRRGQGRTVKVQRRQTERTPLLTTYIIRLAKYCTAPPDTTRFFGTRVVGSTKQTDEFNETIEDSIQTLKITTVLGMNEPQESSQANMTPAAGAEMWKRYLEPLKTRGIRLGSPAPSGSATSKPWLQGFMAECDGNCTVDFIAIHWYNTNSTAFKEFITDFHDEFHLNIWVTEWACQNMSGPEDQCSLTQVVDFLRETQTFMDQMDWVERYAWYGVKRDLHGVNQDNAMMDPDGVINDLGRQYISQ